MSKSETLRAAENARFAEMLGEISPLEGAHDLLVDLARRGYEIILASSSPEEYLDRYLDLLAARDLVDAATTAKDVEATKPEPDIIESAKAKAHLQPLVMVGDSPWDIESADRAGMSCISLLTGGYSERELLEAGAEAVFASLIDLRAGIGTAFLADARDFSPLDSRGPAGAGPSTNSCIAPTRPFSRVREAQSSRR